MGVLPFSLFQTKTGICALPDVTGAAHCLAMIQQTALSADLVVGTLIKLWETGTELLKLVLLALEKK